MPLIRVYLALSLDGYIADKDGGVEWLNAYMSPEIDFMGFMASIGCVVMGRRTFDQAVSFKGGWHYSGMPCYVLSHRPAPAKCPKDVVFFHGDVGELADKARGAAGGKDVWHMGGGLAIQPFREAGLIDRWELSFIPVVLGGGVPLFPEKSGARSALRLLKSRTLKNGILSADYEPARK
jgi:dihydrofolate reductase